MLPAGPVAPASSPEAEAFVRFCYRRRRVGWPELYDEMCAVASRGLFQGMGPAELAEVGVGFSLFQTPRLASLVAEVVADERAARRAALAVAATAPEAPASPAPESRAREVAEARVGTAAGVPLGPEAPGERDATLPSIAAATALSAA